MRVIPSSWTFKITPEATKQLADLPRPVQTKIIHYVEKRVLTSGNPRAYGKPLQGPLKHFWAYRVGEYRLLTRLDDQEMVILAVRIAHRRHVYT